MRKVFILLVGMTLSMQLLAQNGTKPGNDKGSRTSSANGGTLPSSILSRSLVTELSLQGDQEQRMNKAIYNYLLEKKKGNQQAVDKTQATQRAFTHFTTELKTVFTDTQMTKFLALKPKKNDPQNPYSILFY